MQEVSDLTLKAQPSSRLHPSIVDDSSMEVGTGSVESVQSPLNLKRQGCVQKCQENALFQRRNSIDVAQAEEQVCLLIIKNISASSWFQQNPLQDIYLKQLANFIPSQSDTEARSLLLGSPGNSGQPTSAAERETGLKSPVNVLSSLGLTPQSSLIESLLAGALNNENVPQQQMDGVGANMNPEEFANLMASFMNAVGASADLSMGNSDHSTKQGLVNEATQAQNLLDPLNLLNLLGMFHTGWAKKKFARVFYLSTPVIPM